MFVDRLESSMNPMLNFARGFNSILRFVWDIVIVFPEDTPPFTQRLSGAGFRLPFFLQVGR